MARAPIKEVQGLIPVIDRTKIGVTHVLDGRNFLVDVNGPHSGFGRAETIHSAIADPEGIASFDIASDVDSFIFAKSGVFELDRTQRKLLPQYLFDPALADVQPWSQALVGGKYYFARRGVGLLEYDPTVEAWTLLSGGSIPNDIVSCAESGGRLIVLTDTLAAWSAIDDGTDFVTSTSTGAGAQLLSVISNSLVAYKVLRYSAGFVVYTSKGILRAELVLLVSPFRVRVLSIQHAPFNPFCVVQTGQEEHVMLTEVGFFKVDGGAKPEAWEPAMGEYLHRSVLPNVDPDAEGAVRLFFNFSKQWFMVAFATITAPVLYDLAYVLYVPAGSWGEFDRVFSAMASSRNGKTLGYFDDQGDYYEFTGLPYDTVAPSGEYSHYLRGIDDYSSQVIDGVTYFRERLHIGEVDESNLRTLPAGPGWYDLRYVIQNPVSDWATVVTYSSETGYFRDSVRLADGFRVEVEASAAANEQPLDSWVDVGLLRAGNDQAADELSSIQQLSVQTLDAGPEDATLEDYAAYDVNIYEDWAVASGDEDWGKGAISFANYVAKFFGTLDGKHTWEDQELEATLAVTAHERQVWVGTVTGLYNFFRLIAAATNEAYHFKSADLTITPAGKLI